MYFKDLYTRYHFSNKKYRRNFRLKVGFLTFVWITSMYGTALGAINLSAFIARNYQSFLLGQAQAYGMNVQIIEKTVQVPVVDDSLTEQISKQVGLSAKEGAKEQIKSTLQGK